MLQKHTIALGFTISILLLVIGGFYYPGGSPLDPDSVGFQWTQNYITNLLNPIAVNGAPNAGRIYGIMGAVVFGFTLGLGMLRFAQKTDAKGYTVPLTWLSIISMITAVLIVIPAVHDLMVLIGSIFNLLMFFYVTVVLIRSKLMLHKIVAIVFLASFYAICYMYFSRTALAYMPLAQKLYHVIQIVWVLRLEYTTKKEDFAHL
jgi:hypothetical protein